jgi:hypothetical protein
MQKTARKGGFFSLFTRIVYHEAKMLARKGIFAKPSMMQPHEGRLTSSARAKKHGFPRVFCNHYTTKRQKNQDL